MSVQVTGERLGNVWGFDGEHQPTNPWLGEPTASESQSVARVLTAEFEAAKTNLRKTPESSAEAGESAQATPATGEFCRSPMCRKPETLSRRRFRDRPESNGRETKQPRLIHQPGLHGFWKNRGLFYLPASHHQRPAGRTGAAAV